MKKIVLGIISLSFLSTSAMAFEAGGAVPAGLINQINGVGSMGVHDMQYIRDNQFRYREYNDYKDMQEQKDAKNKEFEITEPAMKRIFNRQQKTDIQVVEENGEIKIQGVK